MANNLYTSDWTQTPVFNKKEELRIQSLLEMELQMTTN
jgi:hypothetical protein